MYGKYPYKVVDCPFCGNRIKIYSDDAIREYDFRGRDVSLTSCGVCGKVYIVDLNSLVVKDKSFDSVKEAYFRNKDITIYPSFTKDLYNSLLSEVITEEEECIECTDELYEELEPLP